MKIGNRIDVIGWIFPITASPESSEVKLALHLWYLWMRQVVLKLWIFEEFIDHFHHETSYFCHDIKECMILYIFKNNIFFSRRDSMRNGHPKRKRKFRCKIGMSQHLRKRSATLPMQAQQWFEKRAHEIGLVFEKYTCRLLYFRVVFHSSEIGVLFTHSRWDLCGITVVSDDPKFCLVQLIN
jgi:hypothetical protein